MSSPNEGADRPHWQLHLLGQRLTSLCRLFLDIFRVRRHRVTADHVYAGSITLPPSACLVQRALATRDGETRMEMIER